MNGKGRAVRPVLGVILGAALMVGFSACGGSSNDRVTLKLGYVTTPQHPYGIAIAEFAKRVAAQSGGKITIETVPSYQGGDIPLLNDVTGGTIPMASVSSAVWATKNVKSFDALQMPFLITRYDLEKQVISGPIGKAMLTATKSVGVVGLAIHEGGLRKPLGKKPITTLADWKGLKVRSVQSPVLQAGLEALGATPTPIPVTEVYTALRNGTVDAMESNLGLTNTLKLYEVAKYTTLNVNLWPFPTVLVMNQKAYDKLSDTQRSAITTAASGLGDFSITFFQDPKNNVIPGLCEKGAKFALAKPEDIAAMAQATKSVTQTFSADAQTKGFIDQISQLKSSLAPPPAPAALPTGCGA